MKERFRLISRAAMSGLGLALIAFPASLYAQERSREGVSQTDIVKQSQSYTNAGKAAADFQSTESQKAARSLMSHRDKALATAEPDEPRTVMQDQQPQPIVQKPFEITNDLKAGLPEADAQRGYFNDAHENGHKLLHRYND